MDGSRLLYFLLYLFAINYLVVQSQVISCGGFVKSFNNDVFSKIRIKLESSEGLTKFETDVTPSNGYYMVPIYNKGSYAIRIEGPEGFVFEPSRFPLTINGQDDPCTKGEDINFNLFGFTVSGHVRSGEMTGLSHLNLALFAEDNTLYASTVTDEFGAYQFNASPGKYVVTTSDNTQQCVERGSVSVEVKDRPVVVQTDIRISGHSLVVSVRNYVDSPLSGTTVLLVSDQSIPFDQQINAPKPTVIQNNSKWEYRLLTDKIGTAVFTCLPPGKYEVSASWSTKKTSLEFSPPRKTIVISSEIAKVVFKAEGFDVIGQVYAAGQKPLDGVNIIVDGKVAAVSEDGNYKIKSLKPGQHNIEAKKEHFYFDKLVHEISIENPILPVIQSTKLEVCGFIKFDDQGTARHKPATPEINVLERGGAVVEKLHIETNGDFCTFLPPGAYTIKPSRESKLKPDFIDINVLDEPVLNLFFTEFKTTISGRLKCLSQDECDGNAVVSLLSNDRGVDSVSIRGNKFVFNEVLPGRYDIQIAGLDSICLDDERKSITVESNNLDVVFRQTGYRAQIYSPIDMKMNWKHESEGTGHIDITAGHNSFCLPRSGDYILSFDTCYEFNEGQRLTYNLPASGQLSLSIKSAYLSASIQSDVSASQSDFKLQISSSKGNRNLEFVQNRAKNFSYTAFIENELVGQELELIPKSERFLFVPASHKWTFNGECSFNKVSFNAKEGRFVTGSVEPAVESAVVRVKHVNDGSVLTSTTDLKGNFKIGLVFNPDDYEVDIQLEGYKFVAGAQNKFKSIRLSKLTVSYFDKTTKKELSDVLISLSGGDNYRENKIVDVNGRITFVGLPAGEYFIRSILREYEFDPASSVRIKEGEAIELRLPGSRFAYSAFGRVMTAGGGPPSGQMKVEAVSQNCGNLQEDELTDGEGQFRVRGLKPRCIYKLSLRSIDDGASISSIPPYISIETVEGDTTELEFTILATAPTNEIVGFVQFVNVLRPKNLRVELLENGIYKTHEDIGGNNVFIFNNVITPSNRYQIRINEADLRNLNAVAEPVEFLATHLTKNIILNVAVQEKLIEIETSKSSFFGVLFVFVSAFVCLNFNYSKELLIALIDHVRIIVNQQRDNINSSAQDRRRKQKKN